MDFLIYGRAVADAPADTPDLDEAHWSYMDAFADRMTARGPTLSPDRTAWTGSLHVVDLADAAQARAFAVDEPYHRAGLFSGLVIRRFENLLGRTMWQVPRADGVPFLVLADGATTDAAAPQVRPPIADRLVVWGRLRRVDAPEPSGMVVALVAPDEAAARSVIEADRALLGGCEDVQVHAWEFGGRR